jgi:nitrogen fixation-related uncharacterized protein
MDTATTLLILTASIAVALGALALAAARWGADSRPTIGDDHAR